MRLAVDTTVVLRVVLEDERLTPVAGFAPPHRIPPSPAPVRRRPASASSFLGRRTTPPLSLLLSLTSLSPLYPRAVDAMDPPGKPRSSLPRRHRRSPPRRPPPDPPSQPLPRADPAPAISIHRPLSALRRHAVASTSGPRVEYTKLQGPCVFELLPDIHVDAACPALVVERAQTKSATISPSAVSPILSLVVEEHSDSLRFAAEIFGFHREE